MTAASAAFSLLATPRPASVAEVAGVFSRTVLIRASAVRLFEVAVGVVRYSMVLSSLVVLVVLVMEMSLPDLRASFMTELKSEVAVKLLRLVPYSERTFVAASS